APLRRGQHTGHHGLLVHIQPCTSSVEHLHERSSCHTMRPSPMVAGGQGGGGPETAVSLPCCAGPRRARVATLIVAEHHPASSSFTGLPHQRDIDVVPCPLSAYRTFSSPSRLTRSRVVPPN